MCVTGNASEHVSPPPHFNRSWAIGEHQFSRHWEKVGLAPGELCVSMNAWVGSAYTLGKLHPKTTKDNNFQWLSVSLESCWNPGKWWWKQMWERCFWGNVSLVTSRDKHNYEMMQWRKASTEERNTLLLSTVLLCLNHALVHPIMWFLLGGRCTTLPCLQIASDSVFRVVCSLLFPGSAVLVLDFFQPTPSTCIVLCYQWFPYHVIICWNNLHCINNSWNVHRAYP